MSSSPWLAGLLLHRWHICTISWLNHKPLSSETAVQMWFPEPCLEILYFMLAMSPYCFICTNNTIMQICHSHMSILDTVYKCRDKMKRKRKRRKQLKFELKKANAMHNYLKSWKHVSVWFSKICNTNKTNPNSKKLTRFYQLCKLV